MSPTTKPGTFEHEERLMTVKDVQKMLRASRGWVYAAVQQGKIPHLRLGAMVRFDPVVVRAWLAQQRAGPALTSTGLQSVTSPSMAPTRDEES